MAALVDHPFKDEPTTPTQSRHPAPLASSSSPPAESSAAAAGDAPQPSTPRSAGGSRIASPSGSMSMSQRRGVRPTFPSARVRAPVQGADNQRGLLTPQLSAGARPAPYPSPIPPLTAPLSPLGKWQHHHQSAPPLTAVPNVSGSGPASGSASVPRPPTGAPQHKNPYQVSLDEIPRDFVMKKLQEMAGKFWYSPQTADCHVVVPVLRNNSKIDDNNGALTARPFDHNKPTLAARPFDHNKPTLAQQQAEAPMPQTADPFQPNRGFWPPTPVRATDGNEGGTGTNVVSSSTTEGHRDVSGRRGSMPGGYNHLEQCIVFPLHRDYLTTQSTLFRALFSSPSAHMATPTPRDKNGRLLWQSPVYRGARLLPTKAERAKAVYVPLPDPASFGVILHWLYWHDANHFNHCLSKGLVTWQGVIRNIEYLGLDHEIKYLAGKWWKRWVKPADPGERAAPASNGKGKGRAVPPGGGMDLDDDEEEDGEEGMGLTDSGEEADEEDYDGDARVEDGFADGVSERLGML
ncbi:hypothetical protein IAT38_001863 [Cryptococcus sp. DSM 104549]